MAALGSQSIASSYEQLLHVDRDGGGNSTTLVNIKDGDNGTTFALQLSTDKIQGNGSLTVGSNGTGFDVQFFGDTAGQHLLWDQSADELVLAGDSKLSFHDAAGGENIVASANGHLEVNAGTTLDMTAPTIDINASTLVQVDGAINVGVNDAGYDVKFFGDTASAYMMWDTSADDLVFAGAAGIDLAGNIDVDGTANLDVVDIDGATQIDATFTSGVDGQGYDTKFFGDTSGAYMMWDTTADDLVFVGAAGIDLAGDIDVDGTANFDNTDIEGTLVVDGSNISLDSTATLNIDNSNTSNGITIATATSGVPVSIGHTTSETTVNDNLVVTGNIDLEGNIDVNGVSNLDNTDIDGTLNVSGLTTIQTGIVPDAQDGAYLGTTSLQWSDLFMADSAVIGFGDDNDTTLTHTDGTGLTLNSTNKLCFNDASQFIQGTSATVLSIGATDEIDLTATTIDINGAVAMNGAITGGTNITISGELDAATLDVSGAIDVDGTSNLDAVDIDGAVQIDATLTSGVDGQGYDTKFFGDTSGAYVMWDTSADDLVFVGAAGLDIAGDIDVDGTTNLDIVDIDGAVNMASTLTVAAGVILNEGGGDNDFRVETTGNTHGFHIDAGSNIVNIQRPISANDASAPDEVLALKTFYPSSGTNGSAGAGPLLSFYIPDDETNPILGAGIGGLKESANDSDASTALAFYTSQDDATLDEAMRITSGGVLSLPIGQIKFPASENLSTDANTLDDYQEGSWTPVFRDASSGGNTAGTASASGRFVKIGSQVTITGEINVNSLSGVTMGNTVHLTGLPFNSKSSTSNIYTSITVGYATGLNISAGVSLTGFIDHNNNAFAQMSVFDDAAGISTLTFTELSDNANVSITATYITN